MRSIACAAVFAFCLGVFAPTFLFAAQAPAVQAGYQTFTKSGGKVPFDPDHYLIFGFDKAPKLGTAIMRVEIFRRDGKRDTSFTVKGAADMPSMRGAHGAGDKAYSLSAKGVYLMPVQLVMPGGWEVSFNVIKNGKTVYRGAYLFDL